MSSFADGLWRHLAHHADADQLQLHVDYRQRAIRPLRAGVSTASVLIILAVVAIASGITTTTPPAYALTVHHDGTITVSLHDVATGIPALNARLAKLGIRETVIPVRADCTAPIPLPLTVGTTAAGRPLTVSVKHVPHGERGFIAARQLSDGKVLLASGATSSPVPPCIHNLSARFHRTSP